MYNSQQTTKAIDDGNEKVYTIAYVEILNSTNINGSKFRIRSINKRRNPTNHIEDYHLKASYFTTLPTIYLLKTFCIASLVTQKYTTNNSNRITMPMILLGGSQLQLLRLQ